MERSQTGVSTELRVRSRSSPLYTIVDAGMCREGYDPEMSSYGSDIGMPCRGVEQGSARVADKATTDPVLEGSGYLGPPTVVLYHIVELWGPASDYLQVFVAHRAGQVITQPGVCGELQHVPALWAFGESEFPSGSVRRAPPSACLVCARSVAVTGISAAIASH
jgi:hypothetical protein